MSLFGSAKPSWATTAPPSWLSGAQQGFFSQLPGFFAPYLQGGNWNADQTRAFDLIRANAANPQANFVQAQAAQLDPNAWRAFYNPYQDQVINKTLKTMRGQQEQDLNAVRARTAAASAFGGSGSRGALQETQLTNDYGQRRDLMTAQLRARGFDQATASAMANTQLQQQANMFNAAGANEAQRNATEQLLGIGQMQYQAPLDAMRAWGSMMPQNVGSTTTTSAPQGPSMLQQLLGLAGTVGGSLIGGPAGAMAGGAIGNGFGDWISGSGKGGGAGWGGGPYGSWT